ncbi:restriction endonuclease subunit S [Corynebacterium tuberculostearicum]|uniref:Restriction endonuclease subunit S n=1 Tax=Corynebacterium tuberculostearicum TaxID=38304 RepID=A0AAE4NIP5_9CORY|nr:restriction endonuclease subunit S [Corynebacterium tuberculostearicum]MDV2418331.1 restriction endonuclease subunit S [Corynebacterium tuberculostearicum]
MKRLKTIKLGYLVNFRNGHDVKQTTSGLVPLYGSGGIFGSTDEIMGVGPSVLFGRKGTLDRPDYVEGPFAHVDTAYSTVMLERTHARFLYYWATTVPYWLYSTQTAIPSMTSFTLSQLSVPVYDLDTQRRIAEYLDTETAQIDTMMAKLDELVELLGERRASVVKTLLDDAPAKGKAPLYLVLSRHFPGEWGDDEGKGEFDVKCVRVADFNRETKTANSDVETIRSITRAKFNEKKLWPGDVLVERSGGSKKKPVGNTFFYNGDDDAICANFIQVLRLNSDNDPKFWNYLLAQAYDRGDFKVLYNQTTGIQNLQMDLFLQKRYPVIPLDEQRRIAEHLDVATTRIDTMIDKCNELRDLLQERRAALITAVVTGQKEVPHV